MEPRLSPETPNASTAECESRDGQNTGRDAIAAVTRMMRQGDEAAYREFYDRYYDRLLRYLLVVMRGDEEKAREALQLTMMRIVRHIKVFTKEDIFWSWLTVLARSAAADQARKESRYFRFLGRLFLWQRQTAAGAVDDQCVDLALESELVNLPADDRELIERKYFRNERVAAIAAALSLTPKAVESRLVRVRRRLKEGILGHLRNE